MEGMLNIESIILQPAANKDARAHYEDTIIEPVEQSKIFPYVNDDIRNEIERIYGDNPVPVWGVTPGINDVNKNKWDRIKSGDISLFSGNKIIFASGEVTFKFQNADLARELWGEDENNNTWEYMYLLDDIHQLQIPQIDFNRAVGYQDNYITQSFNVLDEERSSSFLSTFELSSGRYSSSVAPSEFENALDELDDHDSLDVEYKSTRRREQNFIRKSLFGNRRASKCSVCDKTYPIEFLIAAHIKKRSFCTREEKLDTNNVALPMCSFGCDDLFEEGYISGRNGTIIVNDNKYHTTDVTNYIRGIEGNHIVNWDNDKENYFTWHRQYHSIDVLPN